MKNLKRFAILFKSLAQIFDPNKDQETVLTDYKNSLFKWSDEELEFAFSELKKTFKPTSRHPFPVPAEISEFAQIFRDRNRSIGDDRNGHAKLTETSKKRIALLKQFTSGRISSSEFLKRGRGL